MATLLTDLRYALRLVERPGVQSRRDRRAGAWYRRQHSHLFRGQRGSASAAFISGARAPRLAAAGLVLGLAGAVATTRVLRRMLCGVEPTDPLAFTVVAPMLGLIVLLACYLPARRATRIDPLVALRSE